MDTFSNPPILLLIAEACELKELGRWCCVAKTFYIHLKGRWPLLEIDIETSSIELLLLVGRKLQELSCVRVLRINMEPNQFVGDRSAVHFPDGWAEQLAKSVQNKELMTFSFFVHNCDHSGEDAEQSGEELRSNIYDDDVCVLMNALPAGLQVLDLGFHACHITEQAGEAIARAFGRQPHLCEMWLDLGENSADFCDCLIGMIPANLKSLNLALDGTSVLPNVIQLVESLPSTLHELELDISLSDVDDFLACIIIRKVPRCLKRFALQLCNTDFVVTSRSMQKLVNALPPNLACFEVSFSGCVLGGTTSLCFRRALQSLPTGITCLRINLSEMQGCVMDVRSLSSLIPPNVSRVVATDHSHLDHCGVRQPSGKLRWTRSRNAPLCSCVGRLHSF